MKATVIRHTGIVVGDMEQSLRFYRDLLGFEVAHTISWESGVAVADRLTGLEDSAATLVMLCSSNL